MRKRIIALLLAAVIPASFPAYAASEQDAVDIRLSFETEKPGDTFDLLQGGYSLVSGKGGGTAVSLSSYSWGNGRINFGKNISNGIIKISFDYKADSFISQFYIRLFSPKGDVAESFCDKGGVFAYYPESIGWVIGDKRAGHEIGEWYNISYYVDMDAHVIYYYCNDKLYGFTRLKESIDSLNAAAFVNDNSQASAALDNVSICELTPEDETIPYEVKEKAYLEISSDAHGRIFFDKNDVPLKLTLGNKKDSAAEYTLKYQVTDNDRIVNETSEQITFEAKEKKELDISVPTDGYGHYTLKAALYDGEEKVGEAIPYRFSVANAVKEGEKNDALGIQLQSSGYEINQVDMYADGALMSRIGFSFTRGGFPAWEGYELERGVYKYSEWSKMGIQKLLNTGLDIFPIMAFGNFRLGQEWLTPKTPETMQGYANYVVNVLKDVQAANGYLPEYIDIWNEYWMEGSGFNPGYGKAEDYAEMLKITYNAVKKEFPQIKVAGLSGFTPKDLEWVERVLAAGGADYMDIITGHPYYNKELPDECDILKDIKYVKDLFAKYGKGDLPLWLSEWGWPSVGHSGYPDERQTASNFVRGHVILDESGLVDRYCWYSSNEVGNDNGQESRFGLLRGHYAEIADEAKPTFLAASNYIKMMTGAEFVQSYDVGDNVRAFKYKLADGQDALVCWAVKNAECAGFKLNTDAVTLYDNYGNPETIYGVDNTFSFAIDIDPVYIVGNFSSCTPCESLFKIDKQTFGMVQGDKTDFIITKAVDGDFKVDIGLADNMSVINDNAFADDKSKTVISSKLCDRSEEKIPVTVMMGDKKLFSSKLTISYQDPIELSVTAKPYSSKQLDRWQIVFDINANYYEGKTGGSLVITSPAELAEINKDIKISPISAGGKGQVRLNVPKSMNDDEIMLTGTLYMGDYQPTEIDELITLRCSAFAKKKPVIDGVIDKDEWNLKTMMKMNDTNKYIKLSNTPPYSGLNDLSAKVYTAWDYDNFYLAAEVTDDSWNEMEGTDLLWASDGIQIGMAPSKSTAQLTQFDIGKLHDELKVLVEIAANPANQGLAQDAELEIKRVGNVTTYELRMPWKEIFFDGFNVRRNSKIAFSMMINDNDGQGRKGYMENGSGLGAGFKVVGEFLDLFLIY